MVAARMPSEPVPEPWIRAAVRLRLDLLAFDEVQYAPYVRRCQQSGIGFTTMAEVGGTPGHSRVLYELDKTCSADIPGRGDSYTFGEYTEQRLQPSDHDLRGIILAVSGGVWVGMAATSIRDDEHAVSDMTGVLPGHRRRGIALAMKLLAIEYARSSGMRWLVALHHPRNAAAIGMNRRLGFTDYDPRTCK
jgi:GNAT superfamily N-acetyltransferase